LSRTLADFFDKFDKTNSPKIVPADVSVATVSGIMSATRLFCPCVAAKSDAAKLAFLLFKRLTNNHFFSPSLFSLRSTGEKTVRKVAVFPASTVAVSI